MSDESTAETPQDGDKQTVGTYRWEINLNYPDDASYSGEKTETVEAANKETAIAKAKREAGMSSADAYPVYQLEEVADAE